MPLWKGVADASLTDSLTTLKDGATQLLIKYKSGALVTQFDFHVISRGHSIPYSLGRKSFQSKVSMLIYQEHLAAEQSYVEP